jgi:CBS domain containing-hemolysin-like protein
LLVAVGSAVLGAAFVSTDAALGSLSTARVSALLEQSDLRHRAALERYQKSPNRVHATYTAGRVVCAAITAVVAAEMIAPLVPGLLGVALAVVVTVAAFAPLTDVMVTLARRNADVWGPRFATYLRPFELLLWPIAAPLAAITAALAEKLPEPEAPAPEIASAEVEYIVDEVERSGVVGAEPAEMIRNVLEFEDRRARDVMVPRSRIEAIEISTPLAEVRVLVADSGHSRYPVYEGQLDNVVGLLVAKDVFKIDELGRGADGMRASDPSLADIVRRDIIFVHEQQKLVTLLREMRQKRQHLAVVVDEFGGTSGIITLEDIIEEIVGDIRDEHDEAEAPPIQEQGDGCLVANGNLLVGDLSTYLGIEVPSSASDVPLKDLFGADGPIEVGTTVERWGLSFIAREVSGDEVRQLEVVLPARSSTPPRTSSRPPRRSGEAPASDGRAQPSETRTKSASG